jgi:hypothetical protein
MPVHFACRAIHDRVKGEIASDQRQEQPPGRHVKKGDPAPFPKAIGQLAYGKCRAKIAA